MPRESRLELFQPYHFADCHSQKVILKKRKGGLLITRYFVGCRS